MNHETPVPRLPIQPPLSGNSAVAKCALSRGYSPNQIFMVLSQLTLVNRLVSACHLHGVNHE